ncbi:phage virion morphogenesis protein [Melioribacter sp. Ez-97]|uniref:phage virion morphogenesis protein n=1 Tax=Melioribacter sp. Ez-97 TaxID=3423434 RepID=UPI003ED9FCBA
MADNLEQINALIDSIKERFLPNRKLMTAIAEEMYASVINEFRTQGAGSGGWKALRPATLKQKKRKGFADAVLQARGNLIRSIQSSATEYTAVVSTNMRYAAIHHFGGVISMAARTRTLFHRTDRKGNLMRQQSNKNLLVFAKKSHKQKAAYTYGQRAYTVNIPARPFMILTEPYKNNIINIIKRHINGVK